MFLEADWPCAMMMNVLGFRADQKISEVIGQGAFTLSAEVIPPRNGAEHSQVLTQVDALKQAGAEFLSITKGAGGSLRGGSLPIAQSIKEHFQIPAIAHFTCRDLTPQEVENQLIDHHYFGIRNILALRGDPPQGESKWQAREGSYDYAYQLIEQIVRLKNGEYLTRENDTQHKKSVGGDLETIDFCIGAAAYPEHPDREEGVEYFAKKIQAGAEYGITQMLYDWEEYARFLDGLAKKNIRVPILPGVRILKSQAQAKRMMERFEINVPESLMKELPHQVDKENPMRCVDPFLRYMEQLRSVGAPGIHFFVLSDTEVSCEAIRQVAHSKANERDRATV